MKQQEIFPDSSKQILMSMSVEDMRELGANLVICPEDVVQAFSHNVSALVRASMLDKKHLDALEQGYQDYKRMHASVDLMPEVRQGEFGQQLHLEQFERQQESTVGIQRDISIGFAAPGFA